LARELVTTVRHFLPEFSAWLAQVKDPRQSGDAKYPLQVLLLQGVLMYLTHSGSRNQFNNWAVGVVQMVRTLGQTGDPA
jgi:hypothetical protein